MGFRSPAALANAQATYADTRLAVASEWDDLFAAAGIPLFTGLAASDAFEVGQSVTIAGLSAAGAALVALLGCPVAIAEN